MLAPNTVVHPASLFVAPGQEDDGEGEQNDEHRTHCLKPACPEDSGEVFLSELAPLGGGGIIWRVLIKANASTDSSCYLVVFNGEPLPALAWCGVEHPHRGRAGARRPPQVRAAVGTFRRPRMRTLRWPLAGAAGRGPRLQSPLPAARQAHNPRSCGGRTSWDQGW
jgi:hypothetical protein